MFFKPDLWLVLKSWPPIQRLVSRHITGVEYVYLINLAKKFHTFPEWSSWQCSLLRNVSFLHFYFLSNFDQKWSWICVFLVFFINFWQNSFKLSHMIIMGVFIFYVFFKKNCTLLLFGPILRKWPKYVVFCIFYSVWQKHQNFSRMISMVVFMLEKKFRTLSFFDQILTKSDPEYVFSFYFLFGLAKKVSNFPRMINMLVFMFVKNINFSEHFHFLGSNFGDVVAN